MACHTVNFTLKVTTPYLINTYVNSKQKCNVSGGSGVFSVVYWVNNAGYQIQGNNYPHYIFMDIQ